MTLFIGFQVFGVEVRTVKAQEAWKALTSIIKPGVYKGENKEGKECVVEIDLVQSKIDDSQYISAIVKDPAAKDPEIGVYSVDLEENVEFTQYKNGLKIVSSQDDGDEAWGWYTITKSFKIIKKKFFYEAIGKYRNSKKGGFSGFCRFRE